MSIENRENTDHSVSGARKVVLLLAVFSMMLVAYIIVYTDFEESNADQFEGNPAYSSLSSQQKAAYHDIYNVV